jgi:hypothetical protein
MITHSPVVTLPDFVRRVLNACCLAACALCACSAAEEVDRVELRVVTDGAALLPVTTDLGYELELSSARVAVHDLKFTIAGEAHASLGRRLSDFLVRPAHAHPGHFQGGEVTGELPGSFILHFAPAEVHEVGTATLLVGAYRAANFTFARAESTTVAPSDVLLGHTAALHGVARRGGTALAFDIVLDSPEGRELVGIPFQRTISADSREPLALGLSPLDPVEMDTLFDGLDFLSLDADGDGHIQIAPDSTDEATVAAYNAFRRRFQTHDHFAIQP